MKVNVAVCDMTPGQRVSAFTSTEKVVLDESASSHVFDVDAGDAITVKELDITDTH